MLDHFVLTSLDQPIFELEILFSFFTKQATLMRRPTVLSLSSQLVFPGFSYKIFLCAIYTLDLEY
jgi:hypothetical protein